MENSLNTQSIYSAKQEALKIIEGSPFVLQQELQELGIYPNEDMPLAKKLPDYLKVLNASVLAGDPSTRTTDPSQREPDVQLYLEEAKQEIYIQIEQQIVKSIQEQFKTMMGDSNQGLE